LGDGIQLGGNDLAQTYIHFLIADRDPQLSDLFTYDGFFDHCFEYIQWNTLILLNQLIQLLAIHVQQESDARIVGVELEQLLPCSLNRVVKAVAFVVDTPASKMMTTAPKSKADPRMMRRCNSASLWARETCLRVGSLGCSVLRLAITLFHSSCSS